MPVTLKNRPRPEELLQQFLHAVNQHIDGIVAGCIEEMYHIKDFAADLCVHPTHLSNSIKQSTGRSACFYMEAKIITEAKRLLRESALSVSEIAALLTFDASNFTKFFKRFEGQTPSAYRQGLRAAPGPGQPATYRLLPGYKSKRAGSTGPARGAARSLLFFARAPVGFQWPAQALAAG